MYWAHHVLMERLRRSVQHEFDAKLAEINSRLRASEESLKADLARKQAEIVALQSGAMQARLNRVAAVDKRRIEAVDQIWSAVHGISYVKGLSAMLVGMKLDAMSAEVVKNPRAKQMFVDMNIDETKAIEPLKMAQQARPFLTPLAWAYYAAYQAIVMHALGTVKVLSLGMDATKFVDNKHLLSLVKAALPSHADYIEKFGPNAAYYLLDQLESLLLDELKGMLDGATTDMAEVARSRQILIEVDRINQHSTANTGETTFEGKLQNDLADQSSNPSVK